MRTRNIVVSLFLLGVFLLLSPCAGVCKDKKDDRKDRGHHYGYLDKDQKTKELHFRKEVKEKVDKILKGVTKSIKHPERSKAEKKSIPNRYLDIYNTEFEYVYDYTKDFQGDEDDPDLEDLIKESKDLKKWIQKIEKSRNKDWGWFWDKTNKKHRKNKHGKWEIWPILKKLAWKHYRIALEYHDAQKYEKAKKHLRISIWFWPQFVEAHTQLGIENLALDHIDWAEINCKRAIKIDPYFGKAYYVLSIIYLSKDPVDLFNSVESCDYSKELKYTPDPDYYEFLMLIAKLPPPSDDQIEEPIEEPGDNTDDDDHSGPPGQDKKDKGKK